MQARCTLCVPDELTVRGELGGARIEQRGLFEGTSPARITDPVSPQSLWLDVLPRGETLVLAGPIPAVPDEAIASTALVRVGDSHFYCGGEGTTARRGERQLELTLASVRDLGTCADAPAIAGTISGCGDEPGFCTIESTADGLRFSDDAIGWLRNTDLFRVLTFDLASHKTLWVWEEARAVMTGLLYDAETEHVYCVGAATLTR